MDLTELRSEIDTLDSQLLKLILKRTELVNQVADYKSQNRIPIFAPEREHEILERLSKKVGKNNAGGVKLLYGTLMDLNKLREYQHVPPEIKVPTGLGGASVRAILSDSPSALCRYLSPLAAAEVAISDIRSQLLPGGKLVVDIELIGETGDPDFAAALSVLKDNAEQFTLL